MTQSHLSDFTRRVLLQTVGTVGTRPTLAQAPRDRSGKPIRIGVVGGGFGAEFQWHLHPNCEVAAVCDIRPDRLQRLSKTYQCGNTYQNFREFLKHPKLDAVAVFTPAPLHVWMDIEAMRAGKHVISAVPAGMSEEELQRLLDTVKRTGLKYMMAETSYYRPEIITCRQRARERKFGAIFYSESEYHHEGLLSLMYDDRRLPTWRHGFPPMHYPTHCTGMIVPVTGERLVEVQAIGWGDGHEVLQTNEYRNPFWNTTAFFKTSGGHSARVAVCWHIADGETERGQFYGDRMSYVMARPEKSPNTVISIAKDGRTTLDASGYPQGHINIEPYSEPNHFEELPESMHVKTGHGGSHTFITHEFISAIHEDRHPSVNVWEAIAYTLPGIVAHQSALKGGEPMKIASYGNAPA
jgi:predicted dehydrogenase